MVAQPEPPVHLTAYPDVWVTRPGTAVTFHVNSPGAAFNVRLVELMGGFDAGMPRVRHLFDAGSHTAIQQNTDTGSFVVVDRAANVMRTNGFKVCLDVWPTLPGNGHAQTLISRADDTAEITLRLTPAGHLQLHFAMAAAARDLTCRTPLQARTWYRIEAAVTDSTEACLYFRPVRNQSRGELIRLTLDSPIARPSAQAAVTIGARLIPRTQRATEFFEGKIDAPQLWDTTTTPDQPDKLVAAWDFGFEPASPIVRDVGPHQLHGRAVNAPTRLVTGSAWTGEEIDPRLCPAEYRAAHFHSDDLEDAAWRPTFDITLPIDIASGVYAAELTSADDRRWIPFFVAPRRRSSDIGVVLPTFTYLAYANFRIRGRAAQLAAQLRGQTEPQLSPEERYILAHPEVGLSLYDTHGDGSPCCYSSRKRPVLEMSPAYRYSSSGARRHFSADLELLGWLRRRGHVYDVLTDECVHHSGVSLLESYRVILTGSHPEYYTTPMREAVRAYIERGGRVMYLGGNGFYWVTSMTSSRPHLIEVRRGHSGTRTADSPPGEVHHSLTGEPGGLWRHRGLTPQSLVGVGFCGLGYGNGAGYTPLPTARRSRYAHLLAGVPADDVIGSFGPTGGAADDEVDHVSVSLGTPPTTVVLATSKGLHAHGYHTAIEDVHQLAPDVMQPDNVGADIAVTDWPGGGTTFAVSSIGWINCLPHNNDDNNVSTLTENVLRAFLAQTEGVAAGENGITG